MKRASSSEWNRTKDTGSAWNGYLLREGEFGVEVFPDNKVKIKIGNGIDAWKKLPYITGDVGIFEESLPSIEQAETKTFYVIGDKIYYTTDNQTWNIIGDPEVDFNDLKNRPKYNNTMMTSSTNIPKVPTTASQLPYKNTSSGLTALDTQSAIDELNTKLKNGITKTTTPNSLYGNDSAGKLKMFPFNTAKVKDTIAKRTNAGTLKGAEPIESDDLTTKNYVDTNLQPIRNDITNINNSINSVSTRVTNVENRMTSAETKITKNISDIADLKNKVQTNTNNITSIKSDIQTINNQITNINNDITNLQNQASNDSSKITSLESTLNQEITDRQNQNIVSIKGGQGSNQTQLVIEKQDGTKLLGSIPLVSSTKNGLMTSAAFNQITTNKNDIAALKQLGGHYIGRSFATKADLDAYTIPSTVKVGDFTFVRDDETHDDAITRYIYDGTKFTYAYTIENDPIAIATKTKAGIVLSSDTKGQISVDVNGVMRLNGYDDILTNINKKVDKVDGKGLSTNDYTNADKAKVDKIVTNGIGDKFLGSDGIYHEIVIPDDKVQDVRVDGNSIVDSDGNVDLHKVATSGSYNDLVDVPTDLVKDANYVHTDNNLTNALKNKINLIVTNGDGSRVLNDQGSYTKLHTVATSGSYNDLKNIPANLVQDANYVHTDLNFTQAIYDHIFNDLDPNGEENIIESISLNGDPLAIDTNKNVDIDLSDYALATDIPTKTSQLTNDSNFVSDANYVHTDNNFTTTLKTKLDGIKAGAEPNKIEIVKVDGTALPINSSDKSVNIKLGDYAEKEVVNNLAGRVSTNEIDIQSLKVSGLWRGIFDTKADLDGAIVSEFLGGNVFLNDFVIVKADETHKDSEGKPMKTRYYCTAVGTGKLGDIDGDGLISPADKTLIDNFYTDPTSLTKIQQSLADIDQNGIVNSIDSALLNDYLGLTDAQKNSYTGKVGKPVSYPTTWTFFDEEKGNIAKATNTSLGLVKGVAYNPTTKDGFGKVSVDSKGEMTVNGLDTLDYIPLAGTRSTAGNSNSNPNSTSGPVTGPIWFSNNKGGIYGVCGDNDCFAIRGRSTSTDSGYLEIATGDNGVEPIYVRQYRTSGGEDGFNTDIVRTLTLLNGNGNTTLPGYLEADIDKTYKMRIGGNTNTTNSALNFTYLDNRKVSDNTLLSNICLHDDGVVNLSHGKKLALGIKSTANGINKYNSIMQWNQDEQCVEFVFD